MACIELGTGTEYSVLAQRNNSLTPATRCLAFAGIALVCTGIAGAFALAGAPYVLPFAGIELAALAFAFGWVERHAGDYERVTLRGNALEIEVGDARRVERRSFNPQWAQVLADGDRLAVRERGNAFAFGRLMTPDERAHVARALRRQMVRAAAGGNGSGRQWDSGIAS
ncbi:MAG: DUF2244 domain-containing protein [Burkholderiales bacterium]